MKGTAEETRKGGGQLQAHTRTHTHAQRQRYLPRRTTTRLPQQQRQRQQQQPVAAANRSDSPARPRVLELTSPVPESVGAAKIEQTGQQKGKRAKRQKGKKAKRRKGENAEKKRKKTKKKRKKTKKDEKKTVSLKRVDRRIDARTPVHRPRTRRLLLPAWVRMPITAYLHTSRLALAERGWASTRETPSYCYWQPSGHCVGRPKQTVIVIAAVAAVFVVV